MSNFSINQTYFKNDSITISSNLKLDSFAKSNLKLYKITDSYEEIDYSFVFSIDITITPLTLEENNSYIIVLFDLYSNYTLIDKEYLKFLVSPDIKSRNSNDFYYQSQNLSKISSIEEMIFNGDILNFDFTPTKYDLNLKKYISDKDSDGNVEVIRSNAQQSILNNFENQFLYEYKNYFNDIKNKDTVLSEVQTLNANTLTHNEVYSNLKTLNNITFDKKLLNCSGEFQSPLIFGIDSLNPYIYTVDLINSNVSTISGVSNPVNISEDELNKLNLLFYNNITKLNSLKGTKTLIEFVLGVYSKFLGYQLISVIEDQNNPFLYRVSTSVPKDFWRKNIKDIVHPVGWGVVYNYVDSIIKDIVFDKEFFLKKVRNTFNLGTFSLLDADHSQKYTLLQQFIHLNGNINPEYVYVHENVSHNECKFSGHNPEVKSNINFNAEKNSCYYYLEGVNSELYFPKNYKFGRNNNFFSLEYKTPGIGTEYFWKIYSKNKLLEVRRTPFPVLNFDLIDIENLINCNYISSSLIGNGAIGRSFTIFDPNTTIDLNLNIFKIGTAEIGKSFKIFNNINDVSNLQDIRVELTLKRDNWERTVFQYDSSHLKQYKAIIQDWTKYYNKNKFLNVLSSNNKSSSYDMLSLESFTSHNIINGLSLENSLEYTFFSNPVNKTIFQQEFDLLSLFGLETEVDTDITKITITYKKPGVATKYIWSIYNDDALERTYETYFNKVEFTINSFYIQNYKIYLTIENSSFTYDLTNYIIFALKECNKSIPYFVGKTIKPSFLINDLYMVNNLYTDIFTIEDFSSEAINTAKPVYYNINYDLFENGIVRSDVFSDLNNLENYNINIIKSDNTFLVSCNYNQCGFASKYIWKIGYIGSDFRTFETLNTKLEFKIENLDKEIYLLLELERDDTRTDLEPVYLLKSDLLSSMVDGQVYNPTIEYLDLDQLIGFSEIETSFIIG